MFLAVQGCFAALQVEIEMARAEVMYAPLVANVNHAALGMKLPVYRHRTARYIEIASPSAGAT